ncbi:MAG: toll/interleukin-1 receptor domain-containing protein [Mycolicibacterium sp.]|nr:toll/interleukin-1 receptor domain-containing protein [Mycolicibacterium sp.]
MTEPVATCFISYSHADKPLAEALSAGLTGAGYQVWIDSGELRIGDSLVAAVSGAIDRVDFLIALVSSTSVKSNWCQKEISLAMTDEIARKGVTVDLTPVEESSPCESL